MGKPRDGRPQAKSYQKGSKGDNSVKSNRRRKTEWTENAENLEDMVERLSISEGEEEEGKLQEC